MYSSLSRSRRLRKYEKMYNKYIIKGKQNEKSQRKSRRDIDRKTSIVKKKPKKLNEYQKFLSRQSKKEIYKGVKSTERFSSIARQWELQKKANAMEKK